MSAVLFIIRWWLFSENDVYVYEGGIDKGSTATATTGHAVAAGKGEAYYTGSVRCHFRLSTVMMDKDTSPAPYIQKKGPIGTFFVILTVSPVSFREGAPLWHIVSPNRSVASASGRRTGYPGRIRPAGRLNCRLYLAAAFVH